MKKKIIIIFVIFILILFIVFILNNKNTETNTSNPNVNKLNNNSNVIKNANYKNLSITDVSITIDKNKVSTYSATVTNMEDDNSIETINIILKDENGNIVSTLVGFIGSDLKKGEQTVISSTVSVDLSNVTSVEYEEGN